MPSRIRDRKLVQWLIAYAAVAWVVVQGLEVATEAFPQLTVVLRTALVLALMGVPIVAITANVMKGDRERTLSAGCDGYIEKPIDVDKFIEQIERFLG